ENSATLVHVNIPIYQQSTPAEKERALANLEAYLTSNRDHIQVGSHGELYIAADKASQKPLQLSQEDRARVKKDPVCVLKLLQEMLSGGKGSLELNARCGEALLGVEGAKLFTEVARQSSESEAASLDFQSALAAARGKYPSV